MTTKRGKIVGLRLAIHNMADFHGNDFPIEKGIHTTPTLDKLYNSIVKAKIIDIYGGTSLDIEFDPNNKEEVATAEKDDTRVKILMKHELDFLITGGSVTIDLLDKDGNRISHVSVLYDDDDRLYDHVHDNIVTKFFPGPIYHEQRDISYSTMGISICKSNDVHMTPIPTLFPVTVLIKDD